MALNSEHLMTWLLPNFKVIPKLLNQEKIQRLSNNGKKTKFNCSKIKIKKKKRKKNCWKNKPKKNLRIGISNILSRFDIWIFPPKNSCIVPNLISTINTIPAFYFEWIFCTYIFQLSKLQAANRAASVSYEQELEQTTTKVFIYFVLEM